MRKLTVILQGIQIGHKCHLLIILFFFQSCYFFEADELGDQFTAKVLNDTSYDLTIVFQSNNGELEEIYLTRDELYGYNGHRGVFDGDDIVSEHLFQEIYNHDYGMVIYVDDVKKQHWEGPPREMGESVHNFYNYSSWESQDGYNYIFTIKDSDLIMN